MDTKTVTPDELRRQADRLEDQKRRERLREVTRRFHEIKERTRRSSDAAVRLGGIAEMARVVMDCPDSLSWDARNVMLATIAHMAEDLVEDGLV